MLNEEYEKVKQFQKAFNCPYSEKPVFMGDKRASERADFMSEEIREFVDATNIYEQADAMIDLIYFALGTMVEMGVKPKEIFDIVHNANMTKLWDDGKVHFRESDNKVMKPPNWEDPEPKIIIAIDNQSN